MARALRPSDPLESPTGSGDTADHVMSDARYRQNGAFDDGGGQPRMDDAVFSQMTPASINGNHDSPLRRAG